MNKEYLARGILATLFAIILLIALFLGIRYFLKDSCDKGTFESMITSPECIKISSNCKHQTIEILNNCNKNFIITDYSLNSNIDNIEYSDITGSTKNLLIILSKDKPICDYGNITLTSPKTEKDLIQMNCNNLFIPNNYRTIIQTGKSFSIKNNEISIIGSWK